MVYFRRFALPRSLEPWPHCMERPRPDVDVQDLKQKSDAVGLLAVLRDWVFIGLAIALAEWCDSFWITVAAIWFIGCQQYALGEALVHEASHLTLFRTRSLNTRLQFLFAWPFFKTIRSYRRLHTRHHLYLGTPGDPVSDVYVRLTREFSRWKAVRVWFIEPFTGISGAKYFRDDICEERLRDLLPAMLINGGALAVCLGYGVVDKFLVYWVIPHFWAFAAFYHWQEIEDHYLCGVEGRMMIGRIRGFLHHGTGYHHVHHLWPSIPFNKLRRAFKRISIRPEDISSGWMSTFGVLWRYGRLRDEARCNA